MTDHVTLDWLVSSLVGADQLGYRFRSDSITPSASRIDPDSRHPITKSSPPARTDGCELSHYTVCHLTATKIIAMRS